MSVATESELVWEIILPENKTVPMGSVKPTGTLIISLDSDEVREFRLPATVAKQLDAKLKSGELNPATPLELFKAMRALMYSCARARIQRLLDRREYSSHEVRRKLHCDGYESDIVEACIKRACEVNLINDDRYAEAFARSKISAGWGYHRICAELTARGIKPEDVPGWPYGLFDHEDEEERAYELLKRRHISAKRPYEKFVHYLWSRGFSQSVAMRAARRVLDEAQEADDC